MIVQLRYTDDINMHPFRDATGKEGIAILIFPETEQEKRKFQVMRWKLNHSFQDILIWVAKTLYPQAKIEPRR